MNEQQIKNLMFNITNMSKNVRLNKTIKQYSKQQINKIFGFELNEV